MALLDDWRRDLRVGTRAILRTPVVAAVSCLTLALGVGANAAVFSLLYKVLLQTPPGVTRSSEIKRVGQRFTFPGAKTFTREMFSYPELASIERAATADGFSVAGYAPTRASLGAAGEGRPIGVEYVVGDYFGLLGSGASVGRVFSKDEAGPTSPELIAVISARLWTSQFGRRSDIVGQQLVVDKARYTVIGVARAPFRGLGIGDADVWIPFSAVAQQTEGRRPFDNVSDLSVHMLVRLGVNSSRTRVAGVIDGILRQEGAVRLDNAAVVLAPVSAVLDPERDHLALSILTRLMGAVLLILIVASANVASILLARALDRRRDLAVRLALGASRGQLLRHLSAEVAIVLAISGLAATGLAALLGTALRNLMLPGVEWGAGVFGLGLVACVVAGLGAVAVMVSIAPLVAIDTRNIDVQMRATANASPRGKRVRQALIALQSAISVALCAGAGIFGESLYHVMSIDIGYRASDVTVATAGDPSSWFARGATIGALLNAELQQIRRSPLVESAALSVTPPIGMVTYLRTYLPGADSLPVGLKKQVFASAVSPGFLTTMGVALERGRDLRDSDVPGSQLVVLVNAAMAADYWPGQDPIGKCIIVARRTDPCRVVVGVVGDVHTMHIFEDQWLGFYLPLRQAEGLVVSNPSTIVVRARSGVGTEVREQLQAKLFQDGLKLASLHPRDWHITLFSDILAPELRPWRTSAGLFGALAVVAVCVAGVGVFGTVSYSVAQRTREIAIRRTLGASEWQVSRSMTSADLAFVCWGAVGGALLSLAMGRLAKGLVYGVSPYDPATLAAAGVVLLLVAACAIVLPVRRATTIDPLVALSLD